MNRSPPPPAGVIPSFKTTAAGGGPPPARVRRAPGASPPLLDGVRKNFVLLLTDGLPNCNPSNSANPSTCSCTSNACGAAGSCSTLTCLDDVNTVGAISELKGRGISTLVVGFGADTACGNAPDVLDQMATAGGFPQSCAGCRKFYAAKNAAELSDVLTKIIGGIDPLPCELAIAPQPSDPSP